MVPLPIDAELPRIIALLADQKPPQRNLVLVAEPGAGKTTRLPPAILRSGLLQADHPKLVLLQPRRVAARAAAMRIAEENGWSLGQQVGYHIRFEKQLTDATPLRVYTEGILTRQLLSDAFLPGVGLVVLDEFHERSIHTDMAIAMLRELQTTVRPDLRIVVMSATLAADRVANYLGDCPIVRIAGRVFPVQVEHVSHIGGEHLIDRTATAIRQQLQHADRSGDVLVFLPGADEIRRVGHRLEDLSDIDVLPLHGNLPAGDQLQALRPSVRRKVILSTNIAETSLTIDGVRIVIDSGLARVPAFDARRGLDRLELQQISKASAEQRRGRAGRTSSGWCVRLWSAKEHAVMAEFDEPEISRIDLSSTVLDVFAWGKRDPADFNWLEAPPENHLQAARNLLEMLGALAGSELTKIGEKLKRLPVHPRIGRLLLAAAEAGLASEGAAIAALISERDIFRREFAHSPDEKRPALQGDSDLLVRLDALDRRSHEAGIDPIAMRAVEQTRKQLFQIARRLSHDHPAAAGYDHSVLLKLILQAYPDRVCRRRTNDSSVAAMVGGGAVRIETESAVRQAEFFVAIDARYDPRSPNRQASVRIASSIDPAWLFELFPQSIVREKLATFDEAEGRVIGSSVVRYRDLILSTQRDAAVDPQQAAAAMAEALLPRVAEIFAANEKAAEFLARVAMLRAAMPEHPWPKFDAAELAEILGSLCAARPGVKIDELPLAAALAERLAYPLDRLLEQHAPVALTVPSGSAIRVQYSLGSAPVLAVRLQEIFGWQETPRIAGGRVPVLLHLLAPNYRVAQITADLRSFWADAYFQVRKDLRVRYPKHSWPDDPLTAEPQAKGTRRNRG